MKEYFLLHPLLTVLILILIVENTFVIIRGKKKKMENIRIKGGITMSKNSNGSISHGNGGNSGGRKIIREGVQHVRPTSAPPPPPPPKQK